MVARRYTISGTCRSGGMIEPKSKNFVFFGGLNEPYTTNNRLGGLGGGARVKAACEMPRPCVRNVEQAQGKPRVSKSSLTSAHM